MIQKVEMYRAVCDCCRKEGWAFSTPALAVQHAKSRLQWQEINGKLYCPDCVEYDEEIDEYKPKSKEE